MRRILGASLVAAALVPAGAAATSPARVQASASEFHLTLSRPSLRAGPAIVELVNYGEDDHDLALRRVGGARTYRIGIVHPDGRGELDTRLAPGRYVLWCTLAGHRERGMLATLRVV
jgi:hypothetical protein